MPADVQPASLWDSSLLEWCQQLKQYEASLPSKGDEATIHRSLEDKPPQNTANYHEAEVAGRKTKTGSRHPGDADTSAAGATASGADSGKREDATKAAMLSDPFAFDPSAFAMGGNAGAVEDPYAFDPSKFGQQSEAVREGEASKEEAKSKPEVEADPFAFDPGVFGMSAAPIQEKDPYAFDPSSFEGQPVSEKREPQAEQQAPADPFAFGPSLFGEAIAAASTKPAEDPFAFNMDAFGDNSTAQEAARPPKQYHADPFAFDMSTFGQPDQMRGEAGGQTPLRKTSQSQRPSGQLPAKESVPQTDLVSGGQLKSMLRKPQVFTKEPKEAFQALTASEVAALREVLLPPLDADSSDEQSSSNEAAEVGDEQEEGLSLVAGLSRESAEQVLELARMVASGLPGSIADAPALDRAAQRAASSIRVGLVSILIPLTCTR